MDYQLLLWILSLGLLIAILVIVFVLINNRHSKEMLEMRTMLNKDLLDFQSSLNKEFDALSDRTQEKLLQMEERISSNLIQSHRSTSDVFNNISERIARIDEAQKGISDLSSEVVSLQSILQDKKARGTFGEIELYSLLETAYGCNNERYQKQYHLPNSAIADAVVFGGENLGIICIDSKFPLENFRRMNDPQSTAQEKESYRRAFRSDVKKHIDDIARKYIIPGTTAEMAYMFIPAEAVFSEIYGSFPDLVDLSYRSKVYLVSPTTLMAYITAIRSIYLGQKKDEKTKEIQKLLLELSAEFCRYYERSEKITRDLHTLSADFENFRITSDKIVKKFERINSGEIDNE